MITLKKTKLINIIGDPVADFVGRKLPLIKEVNAWSEAGIPTYEKKYALKKFEKILEEDKKLQKSSQRKRSAIQKKNEAIFHQKLANLFDIAKVNVEKYLTDDKKLFLSGQRSKSRFGLIDNVVQLSSAENTEDAMDVEPVGKF
ncbi:hypothetical protein KQX54_012938 [Cotesia glomerata]|uniref:Uncharacterized protein n=1 Tax=Cotesia glomerata TaxID=32391 RepID=A0AAV7J6T5_COTGL|nr:hypothetical protein KQX54_012938 [Cotesia glomerata]